jgi:hypothetical protein
VVSFRIRAIYEFGTDLPILTGSELGRAAVSSLHSILRTQEVACSRHKSELEAARLSALREANRKFINIGG